MSPAILMKHKPRCLEMGRDGEPKTRIAWLLKRQKSNLEVEHDVWLVFLSWYGVGDGDDGDVRCYWKALDLAAILI